MNEHVKRVLAELRANQLTVDDLMEITKVLKQSKSPAAVAAAGALTKARWYIAASEYRHAEREMRGLRL